MPDSETVNLGNHVELLVKAINESAMSPINKGLALAHVQTYDRALNTPSRKEERPDVAQAAVRELTALIRGDGSTENEEVAFLREILSELRDLREVVEKIYSLGGP